MSTLGLLPPYFICVNQDYYVLINCYSSCSLLLSVLKSFSWCSLPGVKEGESAAVGECCFIYTVPRITSIPPATPYFSVEVLVGGKSFPLGFISLATILGLYLSGHKSLNTSEE